MSIDIHAREQLYTRLDKDLANKFKILRCIILYLLWCATIIVIREYSSSNAIFHMATYIGDGLFGPNDRLVALVLFVLYKTCYCCSRYILPVRRYHCIKVLWMITPKERQNTSQPQIYILLSVTGHDLKQKKLHGRHWLLKNCEVTNFKDKLDLRKTRRDLTDIRQFKFW